MKCFYINIWTRNTLLKIIKNYHYKISSRILKIYDIECICEIKLKYICYHFDHQSSMESGRIYLISTGIWIWRTGINIYCYLLMVIFWEFYSIFFNLSRAISIYYLCWGFILPIITILINTYSLLLIYLWGFYRNFVLWESWFPWLCQIFRN